MSIQNAVLKFNYSDAAAYLGCSVAAIKAVASVESAGSGFDPEGFPKTLFEGHKFNQFTGGVYSAKHPTYSYLKWTKNFYGKTWRDEKDRLFFAMSLNREAAIKSASWGEFQIMGFNWQATGATSIQDFVNRMCDGPESQLSLFCGFIKASPRLLVALRDLKWVEFAKLYNGDGYAANQYDTKLASAYRKMIINPQ